MTLRVLFDTVEARALAALINTTCVQISHLELNASNQADYFALRALKDALNAFNYAWTFMEIEANPASFAHSWDTFMASVSPIFKKRLEKKINKNISNTMATTENSFRRLAPTVAAHRNAYMTSLETVYATNNTLAFA